MSDRPDLGDILTEDLIEELRARHDAVLIVRVQKKSSEVGSVFYHYGGMAPTALGLAYYAAGCIQRDMEGEAPVQG